MPDTTNPGYLSTTPNAYVNWTLPLNTDFWFEMSESVQAGTGFITVTDGAADTTAPTLCGSKPTISGTQGR